MKVCLQCGQENENAVSFCQRCRHEGFAPPGPQFLTTEAEGKLTVLKCRTPGEAFLVAEELEAADILAIVSGEETMLKEFKEKGFVSIQVSSQSYEAAKELQKIIERRHWDERILEPLQIPMIIVAVTLGLLWCPGFAFFFMLNDAYNTKGYQRKSKSFLRWFFVGFALFFVLSVAVSSWVEGRHQPEP